MKMAVKAFSNVFKRGKDIIRLAISKPTKQATVDNVHQPGAEIFRLQSQVVAPIRNILFATRVSYRTVASQLRRRAAFEFGRPQRIPTFAFVGLALASTRQYDSDGESLSTDIREVLKSKIGTSPIIQQLSLQSFDLGQVIGQGCNAVVYEARMKENNVSQESTVTLDHSSDFEVISEVDEAEDDKWFPPSNENETVEGETTSAFLNSDQGEITNFSSTEDNGVLLDSMSVSVISNDSGSLFEDEDSISIESDDEFDKWSFLEEVETEGTLDEDTPVKYELAVKMMFNYDVESRADYIMKAMEKETVPARIPIYQLEDSWYTGNRVRLKSLPQHCNIVDMIGAFVDPVDVPQMSVAMETYPAALPKRLYANGLGRNMTMYIVMKKYDMTLRQYLKEHSPDVKTRCLLLTQLLEGIVHLSNHGIAHRDIKSDNIFLEFSDNSSVPHLVIGDFGCCLADKEFGQRIPYCTADVDRGGNCSLMAPEISTAVPGRNVFLDFSKSDLWALGSIIYELFSLDNPFYGNQSGHGVLDSRTYKETDLPSFPDSVPDIVRLLARQCLSRNPAQRPSQVNAANLMQIYLWFPDWLYSKPTLSVMKDQLLILTAGLILRGQSFNNLSSEDQLRSTFLQRLNLNDLHRLIA